MKHDAAIKNSARNEIKNLHNYQKNKNAQLEKTTCNHNNRMIGESMKSDELRGKIKNLEKGADR